MPTGSIDSTSSLIIDEDRRSVDSTAAAAAAIGWPAEDLVGRSMPDISLDDPDQRAASWEELLHGGWAFGEGSWLVPDAGAVFLRFIAKRDVPIAGRHTVLVHRWHDAPPTPTDLETAVEAAFPGRSRTSSADVPTAS